MVTILGLMLLGKAVINQWHIQLL